MIAALLVALTLFVVLLSFTALEARAGSFSSSTTFSTSDAAATRLGDDTGEHHRSIITSPFTYGRNRFNATASALTKTNSSTDDDEGGGGTNALLLSNSGAAEGGEQGRSRGSHSNTSIHAALQPDLHDDLWGKIMMLVKLRHARDGSVSCSRAPAKHVTSLNLDKPRGGSFNLSM